MTEVRRRRFTTLNGLVMGLLICGLGASKASADFTITGGFGADGSIGFPNSPSSLSVTFGATGQGSIYQLDGFVNVQGQNYNNDGSGFGTSAQLSYGPPPNVSYTFDAALITPHKLVLTYQFVNQTGISLPGFQFLSYIDADIGSNTTDETATLAGTLSPPGVKPTSFQVGDPTASTIFTNEVFGTLDNTNGSPGDVAMGIGFAVGTVANGQIVTFQVMLSDDGSSLGGFRITQSDPVFPLDSLTYSGVVVSVPEASAWLQMAIGLISVVSAYQVRSRFKQELS